MSERSRSVAATDLQKRGWEVAESVLLYFDSYRLGSVAPIASEIEQALIAAREEGQRIGFEDGKQWAREMIRG
jgi:hypothetical protein